MHETKALPVSTLITLGRHLNCHEHNLMAAFEKFKGKVNVMEKRTAQVGHFPTEDEDFHYVY
jgi:hypothetical protein